MCRVVAYLAALADFSISSFAFHSAVSAGPGVRFCRDAGMQGCRDTGMQGYRYADAQVRINVQVCRYASRQICNHPNVTRMTIMRSDTKFHSTST